MLCWPDFQADTHNSHVLHCRSFLPSATLKNVPSPPPPPPPPPRGPATDHEWRSHFFSPLSSFASSSPLSLMALLCDWDPTPKQCTHLFKVHPPLLFLWASAVLCLVYCGVPCSCNTWEGAGTFSPKCRPKTFTHSDTSVWVYKCLKRRGKKMSHTVRNKQHMCSKLGFDLSELKSFSTQSDLRVEKFHMWPLLLTSSCSLFLVPRIQSI